MISYKMNNRKQKTVNENGKQKKTERQKANFGKWQKEIYHTEKGKEPSVKSHIDKPPNPELLLTHKQSRIGQIGSKKKVFLMSVSLISILLYRYQ